ncbi:hypothetical protein KC19_VG174800 [Ceratodon purpureus]|uniref:Uncharacterized protein n=1 Tax=Ceratodon purpureus TaxID=3225 RepID=A0A8T0HS60_CERPU|nr:hypothetical protein KC19_VG174800 [Ceratodon purpureus]
MCKVKISSFLGNWLVVSDLKNLGNFATAR